MSARDAEHGWLSIAEAAKYANLSERLIRQAISSGDLPAFMRPGSRAVDGRRNLRISRDDVDAWIRSTWEPVVAL